MFPIVTHQCTPALFLRDYNGNKIAQLFSVIRAIASYGGDFLHSFSFNKFVFVYVVNIRFICDSKKCLLLIPYSNL